MQSHPYRQRRLTSACRLALPAHDEDVGISPWEHLDENVLPGCQSMTPYRPAACRCWAPWKSGPHLPAGGLAVCRQVPWEHLVDPIALSEAPLLVAIAQGPPPVHAGALRHPPVPRPSAWIPVSVSQPPLLLLLMQPLPCVHVGEASWPFAVLRAWTAGCR